MGARNRVHGTPVEGQELAAMAACLVANSLPADDLSAAAKRMFAFRNDHGVLIGYGGLELCGADGLLRSVVTLAGARGHGYGPAIVSWLEGEAHRAGVGRLYLLTETAAEFFARCGFVRTPRADAPPAIAATAEFATLCPDGAVCMTREVGLGGQ